MGPQRGEFAGRRVQVAFITGGGSGIGYEIASQLGKAVIDRADCSSSDHHDPSVIISSNCKCELCRTCRPAWSQGGHNGQTPTSHPGLS